MSSKDLAISARNLSKVYKISHQADTRTTAAEALIHRLKNPLQREVKESYWALKDVSFDIYKGDVVGLIGRNGAGKSTLLKVLSRITEPTEGKITLYGRVGSLLEVGTGFHPELTGRENIYLNGAILGMSRREIARHFDAIVDFAEVEKFLDTPVKRYSSGMYVRLAFAVAAHLESEILVVDEVLAVGDAAFQKKCLGKMDQVAKTGRAILFVSHNMSTMAALCSQGVFLERGCVLPTATLDEAIELYSNRCGDNSGLRWEGDLGDENFRLEAAAITPAQERGSHFFRGEKFDLTIDYSILKPDLNLVLSAEIYNAKGIFLCLANADTVMEPKRWREAAGCGGHRISLRIDTGLFAEGSYIVKFDIGIHAVKRIIEEEPVLSFHVLDAKKNTYQDHGGRQNIINPPWEWTLAERELQTAGRM